jgi:aspartyl-tRNA(Asn)/glutamyl-tRNA(Gln) amidotransferase subunit C
LTGILQYASEIQSVDTGGVPPTSHPFSSGTVWRDDVPVPSLDRTVVLEQAPSSAPRAGLFKVPKVL